jgi:hypothetical protein
MSDAPQWFVENMPRVDPASRMAGVQPTVELPRATRDRITEISHGAWNRDRLAAAMLWDMLEEAGCVDVWYLGQLLPIGVARGLAGV